MTTTIDFLRSALARLLIATLFAITLAACGGGSSTTDGTATGEPDNPDLLDVNGDGIYDAEDDINGDGIVNADDQIAYNESQDPGSESPAGEPEPEGEDPNLLPGNIPPDCTASDCVSANSIWSDNTLIAENRSPQSTYAMGIQRILYCLGSENSKDLAIAAYADGIYGSKTSADVKRYQTEKGLVSDGEVGENTWDALQRDISLLVASGDGINELFHVTSVRVGCENLAQFAQLLAEPRNWQLVAEPGGSTYIPFSAHYEDLP